MNTTESIKDTFKTAVRRDDLEYVQSARAAIKGDRLTGANLLLFSIVGVIVALVVWAANAEIDEVTKGQGKVIPSSSV